MPNRQPSPRIVTMVAIAQGLLTLALLLVGLGLGFSIPEPIPPFLVLAVLSGAALAGLIARQWWAVIPAGLVLIGLGSTAFVLIGIGSIWMHGVEWFFLVFFGLVLLVPLATIVVSIKGHQIRERDLNRHS